MKIAPVVLAGGKPGVFEKLTGPLPKTYVKIGGRRLYHYAAEALASIFGKVYVVAPRPEALPYTYVEERGQGIEQAIAAAESYIGAESHILLAYGDVYVDPAAYRALVEGAASAGADGAVLAVPRRATRGYGVLETRPGGLLARIGGEGQWIFGGAALLPRALAKAAAQRGLYEAVNEAAGSMKIAVVPWSGVWHDVNYPEDLVQLLEYTAPRHTYIARGAKVSPTAVVEGPVVIDTGAEIDHFAVVKGPAYIGRGAFIGAHALVRNHADVEEGAVVGSSSEVSHSLICERATVGRASFISYSVVGPDAVVEPNVVTMSVLREGRERLEPIEVRGRTYYKLGALIPRASRVQSGTALQPGTGWH
ncbi:NTP transferase domain-containing protein [Pyrobaculum sp.]|uniref:NTP transferase domain-containing protein n=1 Tax=Pyrobaculum sp. TaxID=2004705 RepID=UPI003D1429DA